MSTEQTLAALSEALVDEYRARATYRKVIERFGPVRPFVNIIEAENRHIAALLRQFQRLHAPPPVDVWQDRVTAPASLAQACAAGIQAEIENEALYARLLDQVEEPEVRSVMLRLQAASRERHLPAFRRCAQRYAASASEPAQVAHNHPRVIQMAIVKRRNALLPWYIGLVVIAITDVFIGYLFYSTRCEAPGLAQFLVLIVVPGVYLVLMYLTFRSQS